MRRHLHFFHRKPNLEVSAVIDLVTVIGAGLAENGFHVTHGSQLPDEAIIVFFEGAYPPAQAIQTLRARGPVGCFVTEMISGDRFYDRMNYWDGQARLRAFEHNLPFVDFVWTTVPHNVEVLGRHCPAAFIEFGYSPLLARASAPPPDIDFSYFGLINEYRQATLEKLSKYFSILTPGRLIARAERDAITARTKFSLVLKQTAEWPLPSASRLCSILHLGGVALRDWTPVQTVQSSMVPMPASDDDFAEYCHAMVRQDWEALRIGPVHLFKELRMKAIIHDVLDRTVPSWRG